MEFLNQNAEIFSEEDRAALAQVMQESADIIDQNNNIQAAGFFSSSFHKYY